MEVAAAINAELRPWFKSVVEQRPERIVPSSDKPTMNGRVALPLLVDQEMVGENHGGWNRVPALEQSGVGEHPVDQVAWRRLNVIEEGGGRWPQAGAREVT